MSGPSPKNFINFVRANPPATLILLYIICMIIVTLTLAIHSKTHNLLDTDILMDTYQLKKFMNDLKVCIKPSDNLNNELRVVKRTINENDQIYISALVPIKNLNSLSSNITDVHGLVSLEGFRWSCSNNTIAKYLEVGFNLDDKVNEDSVCVQIFGQRKILENFLATPCTSHYRYQSSAAVLQTKDLKSFGRFCANGTTVNFDFDRKENTQRFALYLTEENHMRVTQSLLLSGYVLIALFVVCFMLILFYYDGTNPQSIEHCF